MSKKLDTKYTDEAICPHCGYEFTNSWEILGNDNEGEYDCDECQKPFFIERNYIISYTTKKP